MTPIPAPLVKVADESLESVHLAEEALIGTLERTLLDRERLGLLVVVSQHLFGIEELEEILKAIPRLAMGLIPAAHSGIAEMDINSKIRRYGLLAQRQERPTPVPIENRKPARKLLD